jgi:SWI/SNF-related matrix-associated actin-dependent regulator of chromatin subfamily A protein 2/4
MCRNAQKYNEEASLIHEDSIVLETVFANARIRLEQDSEPAEEDEEGEEEEGEENPGWNRNILFICEYHI